MRKFISRSPVTNEITKAFEFVTDTQLQQKLSAGKKGFEVHRRLSYKQRSDKLLALGRLVDAHADKYAELITMENGKPITQSFAEVKKSAAHCRYYAENLERFLKPDRIKTDANKSLVFYEPLGTIYQISPFNFPFWLVFKSVVPMLAVGNSALSRPADSTPLIGLAIEELFREAGFDSGEFQCVFSSPQQLETICQSSTIGGVSFTGSSIAGSAIASIASKHMKKSVMELGGNDPFIVLENADIDLAVEIAVKSRIANAGQVCIAAKRFIINEDVYDKFREKLIVKVKSLKIGDPMDAATQLGPLARSDLLVQLQKQLATAQQQGASLIYGGDKPVFLEGEQASRLSSGNFITPAILEVSSTLHTPNELKDHEVFGPVFTLMKVKNDAEAIKVANDTQYGLGATIISKDVERAETIARQLECGSVFVNEVNKTDSRVPSGGCKHSGFGRECSEHGLKEFTNAKTLWIA